MEQIKTEKAEKFYLWWKDRNSDHRLPAGVAFYEEKYGEYRLKIDFLQALQDKKDHQFYLKPIGSVENRLLFRAEAVLKKDGKYAGRRTIGEGVCSKETNNEVYVDFGPFERLLVLTLDRKAS